MLLFAGVFASFLGACASATDVASVHTPNLRQPARARVDPGDVGALGQVEVQLGKVSSSLTSRHGFVLGGGPFEPVDREELRWADSPETYMRRELVRTLGAEGWARRDTQATAHTLDVDVVSVDNLSVISGRAIRIQVRAQFHCDKRVLFEDTLTIERPVVGAPALPEDVILALVTALDAAAEQLTAKVRQVLVL